MTSFEEMNQQTECALKSQAFLQRERERAERAEAALNQLRDLLVSTHEGESGSLHQRLERECWKQHPEDFEVCNQPACRLLKGIARILNISITMNGLALPDPPAPPERQEPDA